MAQAHDQGFKQAVSARMLDHEPLRRRRDEIMDHLRTVVARAKDAGLVREDVAAEDLPVLLHAVASAGTFDPGQEGLHRRYLAIMLAGLRPPGDATRCRPAADRRRRSTRAWPRRAGAGRGAPRALRAGP